MFSTRSQVLSPSTRRNGLAVRWFDDWCPLLDDALHELPEMETCSHELFRSLMRHRTSARKRIALVTEQGQPIAVIGLRKKRQHWLPVGDLAVPYAVAPAVPGRLFESIRALGMYVRVPDLKVGVERAKGVAEQEEFAVYKIPTQTDWDVLWRELRNHDRVRKARNRCERLGGIELEINAPGAAPWLINRWEEKWRGPGWDMSAEAADIRVAIDYFEQRGQVRSFRLLHCGRPVAGTLWLTQGKTLVAHTSWWDPSYTKYGVGVRLDELFFRWSTTSGYDEVDLGGEFAFKAKWARNAATHMNLTFMPPHLRVARAAARIARSVRDRTRSAHGQISTTGGLAALGDHLESAGVPLL